MSSLKSIGFGFGGVILILFLACSPSSAQKQELRETSPATDDQELLSQMQEILRNIQVIVDPTNSSVSANAGASCNCQGIKCTCCQHIHASKIKLNENCCVSVTYLKKNYGILVSLKCGAKSLFKKEISARNPPPICIGVPYLKRGASVCIEFYNLNAGGKTLSGCSRFLARLLFVTVAKANLGCFRISAVDKEGTEPVAVSALDDGTMELPYYDSPNWVEPSENEAPIEDAEMKNIGEPRFQIKN